MIVYEVNLAVDADIAHKYATWLSTHITEMLSLPGFEKADWYHRNAEDEGDKSGRILWTIHYQLVDRKALVHYLTHEAPRMRQEGIDRFGDKFQATRRILEPYRR